jgi:hypothetical protein
MSGLLDASAYTTPAYSTAAQAALDFTPINHICSALNAFHSYAETPNIQVRSHHFCRHSVHPTKGLFHQCIIYDSNAPDARLIGIEYLVNEETFKSLPAEGNLAPTALTRSLCWRREENVAFAQIRG